MKRILQLILPPVVLLISRRIKKIFFDFSKSKEIIGYENSKLVQSVIHKTLIAKEKITQDRELRIEAFRVFLPFALAKNQIINVIELGGGAGYHYFNAKQARAEQILQWVIVETEEMCLQASSVKELSEITFLPSVEKASEKLNAKIDLVYCSRALQYFPDPLAIIETVCRLRPKYLFISGVTFSPDENSHRLSQNSILSSNGPQVQFEKRDISSVEYSFSLIPRELIEQRISQDYSIEFQTFEEPAVHHFQGIDIPYQGLWAVRKDLLN